MKKIIMFLLVLCLFSVGTVCAEVQLVPELSSELNGKYMHYNGTAFEWVECSNPFIKEAYDEALIIKLGKAGYICKVYSHNWYEQSWATCTASIPPQCDYYRTCTICDKEQKYKTHEPEWVDVE